MQLTLKDLDVIALQLSCVGTLCWAVCFWWMHRISSCQNAFLKELHGMTRRVERLSKVEHELITAISAAKPHAKSRQNIRLYRNRRMFSLVFAMRFSRSLIMTESRVL